VSKQLNISSNFFTIGRYTVLVFFHTKRYGNIPTATSNSGIECEGMKKSQFSTISLYLGNDTR